jgi:hypothetical protein
MSEELTAEQLEIIAQAQAELAPICEAARNHG